MHHVLPALRDGGGGVSSIAVVIPVGPKPSHRQWLPEAIESARSQEDDIPIFLIDDSAPGSALLVPSTHPGTWAETRYVTARFGEGNLWCYRPPWPLGLVGAFNAGVALATDVYGAAIMMGSDDRLLPGAIDACRQRLAERSWQDGYYWMPVEYSDGRTQRLPCHAAMVTWGFWQDTGGFPPETAIGAPDAALISMLMVHRAASLIEVGDGTPLYWHRVHEGQDTAGRGDLQGPILAVRDWLTERGFVR